MSLPILYELHSMGCWVQFVVIIVICDFHYFSRRMIMKFTSGASQTVHEGRIYQLKLFCGKDYPDNPPSIRFQTRINMTCVNAESGAVRGYTQFLLCHNFKNMGLWLTQLTGGTKSLPNAC